MLKNIYPYLEEDGQAGADAPDGNAEPESAEGANAEPESAEEEKVFTQAELDALLAKRIARERKKYPSDEKLAEYEEWKKSQEPKETPEDEAKKKLSEAEAKANKLELKVSCLEKGVGKDSVDDVVALASNYVSEEVDMDEAVDKVLEKYPTFKVTQEKKEDVKEDKRGWGERHTGANKQLSGVEKIFLANNPGLKID